MTKLFDTVLDRAIVPGYSRIGYALRSRHWDDEPRPGALRGKAVLVTGAGRGLGAATAVRLAKLGARVHLMVRSADKAESTLARIRDAARQRRRMSRCATSATWTRSPSSRRSSDSRCPSCTR